jgi:hypothetical protein
MSERIECSSMPSPLPFEQMISTSRPDKQAAS